VNAGGSATTTRIARTLLRVLVRSWNLFHGNTVPPGRRGHLEEMIRLATEDRPDVLCVQEVPLWALPRLSRWSGMTVRHVVTRQALLGARLGGMVTRLHNGFFRSAFAGQANAILLAPRLEPREHRRVRIDEGRNEPRWCQAVRLDGLAVGNLHATNDFRHPEVPAAEVVRAEAFVTELAQGLPCVLAGDFNLRAEHLHELPGWSSLGPGIDHVLVRELAASPLLVWPPERRGHDGAVLSDHAPVEVRIG
jgi:endonuclease/exonuclease/phosphatase family metal-dependent hydrolase